MPSLLTSADPARLAAVDAQCFADAWDASAYAGLCAGGRAEGWLLLDDGGEAAGLLCFQRVADEAELLRIAVLPARRRGGLARWLLARWLAALEAGGVRRAVLEVRAGNTAARSLYAAAGWREVGRRAGYYRAPAEDGVLYAWEAP